MRKLDRSVLTIFLGCLLLGLPAGPVHSESGAKANHGPFAADANTGLAMGGYDPVSYFLDPEPRLGIKRYELRWSGTVWRFANEGNREAFRRSPVVFAPQYGGHGALTVSRGFAAQASPRYWQVHDDRLFLFYSAVNRRVWIENPKSLAREADRRWTTLRETISGF